jgi:hypothetical protein
VVDHHHIGTGYSSPWGGVNILFAFFGFRTVPVLAFFLSLFLFGFQEFSLEGLLSLCCSE